MGGNGPYCENTPCPCSCHDSMCAECGKRALGYQLDSIDRNRYLGNGLTFKIPDEIFIYACGNCGESYSSREDQIVFDTAAYRALVKTIQSLETIHPELKNET
jgi:hypothetical protein